MASPVTSIKHNSVAGRLLAWNRNNADVSVDNLAATTALRRAALPGLVEACEKVRAAPESIKKLPVGLAAEVIKCFADNRELDLLDLLAEIAEVDKRRGVNHQIDIALDRFGGHEYAGGWVRGARKSTKPLSVPAGYGTADIAVVTQDLGQFDANSLIDWINASSKQAKKAIFEGLLDLGIMSGSAYFDEEQRSRQVLAEISCAVVDGRIAVSAAGGVAPSARRAGRVAYPGAWLAWRVWSGPVTEAFLESVLIREVYWPDPYESEDLVAWLADKARSFTPEAVAILKTSHDPVLLEVAINRGLVSNADLVSLLGACDVDTLLRVVDRTVEGGRYHEPFKILIRRMATFSRSDLNQVTEWICEDWAEVLPTLRLKYAELELLLCTLSVGFAEEWSKGTWKTPATRKNIEGIARALIANPERARELSASGWSYDFDQDCPLGQTLVPILPGLVDSAFSGSFHWAEDLVCAAMFSAFGDDERTWEIGISLAVGWSGTLDDYLSTVATLRAQS